MSNPTYGLAYHLLRKMHSALSKAMSRSYYLSDSRGLRQLESRLGTIFGNRHFALKDGESRVLDLVDSFIDAGVWNGVGLVFLNWSWVE